jgi:PKD repeat protein
MSSAARIAVCLFFLGAACGESADPLTGVNATATPRPTTWVAPVDVTFDCDAVGGEAPFRYVWDFGDGTQSPLDGPSHTYSIPGTYTATCQVTDAAGHVDSISLDFQVQPAAAHAQIDVLDTQKPSCAVTGQTTVQLSSTRSTASDGGTVSSTWSLVTRPAGSTATLSSTTSAVPSFSPDVNGDYVVRLHVEDASGLSDDADLTITSEQASHMATISGGGQTVMDADALAPVTLEVQTPCGLPVAGVTVAFTPPPDGTATPASAVSDAAGQVTVLVGSGCTLGANQFTATSASPPIITHVAFTNVQSGPWQVLLANPTDTPVSGPMTVRATVLDRCGYLVSGDSTTAFTLSFHESTDDSSAAFQAVTSGTALDTSDPHAWMIRAANGVVEATVRDSAPEMLSFAMTDSQGTNLAFRVPDGAFEPGFSTLPVSCHGGTTTFVYPDAPPPISDGELVIIGTLDGNSPDKALSLHTEGATPYATVFGYGSQCASESQQVVIDQATLARMQLDGTITLQLTTAAGTDCVCAANELSVELVYTRGVAAHFTP